MGIFDIFKKKIRWKNQIPNECIFRATRGTFVKFGTILIVPEDQRALVVCQGKVTDTFRDGQFELSVPYVPKTTKKYGLDKPHKTRVTKKLVYPDRFQGYIAFTTRKVLEALKFESANFLVVDKKYGKIKLRVMGGYSYKIVDEVKFTTYLLAKLNRLKPKQAEKRINILVGDKIRRALHKCEFSVDQLLSLPSDINLWIMEKTKKVLLSFGIELVGLTVEDYSMRKKYQKILADEMDELDELEADGEAHPIDESFVQDDGWTMPSLEVSDNAKALSDRFHEESNDMDKQYQEFLTRQASAELVVIETGEDGEPDDTDAFVLPSELSNYYNEKDKITICPFCKKDNIGDVVYCGHCGMKLLN